MAEHNGRVSVPQHVRVGAKDVVLSICLLYTSDAADERSSVDLGGRRIIKKKKKINQQYRCVLNTTNTQENEYDEKH